MQECPTIIVVKMTFLPFPLFPSRLPVLKESKGKCYHCNRSYIGAELGGLPAYF